MRAWNYGREWRVKIGGDRLLTKRERAQRRAIDAQFAALVFDHRENLERIQKGVVPARPAFDDSSQMFECETWEYLFITQPFDEEMSASDLVNWLAGYTGPRGDNDDTRLCIVRQQDVEVSTQDVQTLDQAGFVVLESHGDPISRKRRRRSRKSIKTDSPAD